jgi:hypothetical protein
MQMCMIFNCVNANKLQLGGKEESGISTGQRVSVCNGDGRTRLAVMDAV